MINEYIKKRWSPVSFSSKMVETGYLDEMFEAARWAPSSFNEQPWRFVYGRKGEIIYEDLFSCLLETNQNWVQTAPVICLSMANMHFSRNNKPNRFAFHDTGMAVSNLLIQGMQHNIYVHQMGGYDIEMAREKLNLPPGWEPVAMMAIGFLGEADEVPDELKERQEKERTRKETVDFVFTRKF